MGLCVWTARASDRAGPPLRRGPSQTAPAIERMSPDRRAVCETIVANRVSLFCLVPLTEILFFLTPEFWLRPFDQPFDVFAVRPEDENT